MNRMLRYFLFSSLVLSVMFLASCEEDPDGPADPASIILEQNGDIVDTLSGVLPEQTVTVDVQVEFGSEEPTTLSVFDDDGTQIGSDIPISATTNFPIQYNLDVPADASGEYVVTFQVEDANGDILAEEDLLLEVYATVVDIAQLNDGFDILVAALTEANLVTTLQGAGPFTVFAPTDEAFAAIGIESADDLPEGDALNQLLLYHVISGVAAESGDLDEQAYETVEGSNIEVTLGETVFINETAEVILADLVAGNGVVHVVNEVLMPGASILYDEAVLLGGQLNANLGSFYNVLDSTVYTSDEAEANDSMVDFGYWYAEDNDPATADSEAIIGAPDANSFISAFSNTTFSTRNSTRFVALDDVTETEFEGILSTADFDDVFNGDFQTDGAVRLTNLQEGQVFGFQLDDDRGGNVGMIRVVEISGATGAERAITLQVKTRRL